MKNKKLWSWLVIIALVIGLIPNVQYVSAETKTTQYEAEDTVVCDYTNAKGINIYTSAASGGKSATLYDAQYVVYTVSVIEAGTYDVVLNVASNVANSGTAADIPLEITANDGTAVECTVTNVKDYNSFKQYTVALDLVAGTNTIKIENVCGDTNVDNGTKYNFVNLDYISITEGEEESVDPSQYPDAVGRHEAENGNYGSNTLQNGDWYASTSGGAVVGINATWASNTYNVITWTVNAEEAGDYTLTVAYCTDKPVELLAQINGGEWTMFSEADPTTYVVPASAGWNVAATATLNVTLQAGVNTVTVTGPIVDWNANWSAVYNQTGWPSANLDYIELAKNEESETTTPEPVVIPDAVGRHEAENAISFTQGSSGGHELAYSGNYSNGTAVGGMNTWPENGRAYCTTKVNATEAGKYTITIAYGGGEANHPCNIDVRVNEGEWISTLAEPTAGWDTVATISTTIELAEGENTIDVTGACNIWYDGMGWEWVNVDYFELAKVEEETTTPEPVVTTYEVSVDGTVVATVEEGATYTLGDAVNGYVCGDNAYKAGTELTVTEDMAFTTIGDVTVTAAQGAGIRYTESAGIRFQATVNAPEEVLNSAAVTTGTIITAKDIYDVNGQVLTLEAIADKNEYAALNIVNNGWYNNVVGTYCGSVVDIADSNYIRNFIAVAYATITYTDGTSTTVYSNMTGVRSIKGVAQAVQAAGYAGIDAAYHARIDAFAAAK